MRSIALTPTPAIRAPRCFIDVDGNPTEVVTTGRHDPYVGIRTTSIDEAMLACALMDHAQRHQAQCADVSTGTPKLR
jgi:chorismate synthase